MQIVGMQAQPMQPPRSAAPEDPPRTGVEALCDMANSSVDKVVSTVRGLTGGVSFAQSYPGYTGPDDGLSHPNMKAQAWLKPINRWMMNTLFRVQVEGKENLPKDGKNLYCPTHPSVGDPPLVAAVLGKGDYRFVANVILFKGKGGPIITAMGAFPVDRENPSRATIQHGVDLVKEGIPLVIFPEGGISENPNQINPLKRGAAYFAIHGQADRIVPIGVHFSKDTQERPRETLRNLALASVVVGGTLAACGLGPAGRVLAGAVTGALTGAYGLSTVAKALVPQKRWFNPFPSKLAGLAGGMVGGIAGAVVGGCTGAGMDPGSVSQVARVLTSGFCAHELLQNQSHRDIAQIKFGRPIEVESFHGLQVSDGKKVDMLTGRLHEELGSLKAEMSGVPYDPFAPKIRSGTGIPVLPKDPAPLYFHAMAEEPMPRNSCHPGSPKPRPLTLPGKPR